MNITTKTGRISSSPNLQFIPTRPRKAGARPEGEAEAGHDVRTMLAGFCQKQGCSRTSSVRCYTEGCPDHGLKLCLQHHIDHDQLVAARAHFVDLFDEKLPGNATSTPEYDHYKLLTTKATCENFGDAARLLLETLDFLEE